ncbi:MAG: hypothetical protein AAB657_04340 [Patescibacteria group bacterium]
MSIVDTIFGWLTSLGELAGNNFTLPFGIVIPSWVLGLVLIFVGLLILKVVTHVVLRVIIIVLIAALVLFLLSAIGLPVTEWFRR